MQLNPDIAAVCPLFHCRVGKEFAPLSSATGGIGTVFGVVIGAFIMGTLNNGMSILGVGIDWQQAIKGTVLLIAVFFDVYNKNKS